MSRSYRKSPFVPVVIATTAKPHKMRLNRRERHAVNRMLRADPLCEALPSSKTFGDAILEAKEFMVYLPGSNWPQLVRRLRK